MQCTRSQVGSKPDPRLVFGWTFITAAAPAAPAATATAAIGLQHSMQAQGKGERQGGIQQNIQASYLKPATPNCTAKNGKGVC